MKNKRSKSSLYYNTSKKKRRKQEKNHFFQPFHEKSGDSLKKAPPFAARGPMNKTVGPFFIGEEPAPKRSDYTYKKEPQSQTYRFGFTDSSFLYFLAKLSPKQYLAFVTLVGLLLVEELNETESKILYAFISNVADTLQTVVEQEVILNNYNRTLESRALGEALHHDLAVLHAEIEKVKQQLS